MVRLSVVLIDSECFEMEANLGCSLGKVMLRQGPKGKMAKTAEVILY